MPPKRMTANPVRPARYRPGKPIGPTESSSEESGSENGDDEEAQENGPHTQTQNATSQRPAPKATSFPGTKTVTSNLQNVNLDERRRQAEIQERTRVAREKAERERMEREAGFVTESEEEVDAKAESSDEDEKIDSDIMQIRPSGRRTDIKPKPTPQHTNESEEESDDDSGSDDDSDESDSSSSSVAAPKLLRPTFIPKSQRAAITTLTSSSEAAARQEQEQAQRRQEAATSLVQDRLELDALARAAGKKAWDDDDVAEADAIDDTDDLDPELEHQEWIARELARLKRAREAIEEREREIAETERRAGLSQAERDAEDEARVTAQQEEKRGRAKMAHLQKYHHKGAFFQDDAKAKGLLDRDLMGARYVDQEVDRATLPEYLQVRDVTKIGKKGRTRYKDLKSEDTGRFGDYGDGDWKGRSSGGGGKGIYAADERFRPGYEGREGATGANASVVGARKRDGTTATFESSDSMRKRPKYDEGSRE